MEERNESLMAASGLGSRQKPVRKFRRPPRPQGHQTQSPGAEIGTEALHGADIPILPLPAQMNLAPDHPIGDTQDISIIPMG